MGHTNCWFVESLGENINTVKKETETLNTEDINAERVK
jgi:hypothetical protein